MKLWGTLWQWPHTKSSPTNVTDKRHDRRHDTFFENRGIRKPNVKFIEQDMIKEAMKDKMIVLLDQLKMYHCTRPNLHVT
jgi:hypothetical protein